MFFIKILLVIIFINLLMYNYFIKNIDKNIKINNKYRYITIFISYIGLGIGLKLFILPYCSDLSNKKCLFYSSLYGLIIYGIYNIINLLYIKNYKFKLVIYDILCNIILVNITTLIFKYFL